MGASHYQGSSSSCLTLDPSKGGLALQEASTHHSLQQLSYDPSFAERAAKYSTFGNSGNYSSTYSSFDTGRLRDVLENESMCALPRSASFSSQYSEEETKHKGETSPSPGAKVLNEVSSDGVTSQENSSGSAQPAAAGPQRKRKGNAVVEGKGKESSNGGEINSDSKTSVELAGTEQTSLKRQRSGDTVKPRAERSATGSENSGDSSPRSTLKGATSKAPQEQLPKQDYIHVRARRGQATDSHSLAERVSMQLHFPALPHVDVDRILTLRRHRCSKCTEK